MQTIELLAPAKNLSCGIAAIDHGADAVYIGAQRFGARVAAGNSIADIAELCRYAHRFAAKVYVTLNTLLYDDEHADAERLLREVELAGADAVLVQDMALLTMHPKLPLHASTQTDNRTADKVRQLRDLGFSRVVLARELSLENIKNIHNELPDVELEVFVHGALCVSYSGLCYASEYCFGRSANRGECAQFCRLPFDLVDSDGRTIEANRHLLSLKDMCRIDYLEELLSAGVTSLKIEGRLKDETYVKNVVAAYSQRLNSIIRRHPDRYRRASLGECRYTFEPNLAKTFNRGFTDYFLHGRKPTITSFDTPKVMGERVGRVKEIRGLSVVVSGTTSFANGDGLCFFDSQRRLQGFRVNRVDGHGHLLLRQMPKDLRKGVELFRNSDERFERQMQGQTAVRTIPITLRLSATETGFMLSTSQGISVSIEAEKQLAKSPQRDNIIRQLSKLGGTIYECRGVEIPDDFPYFIPNSQLSELRRLVITNSSLPTPHSSLEHSPLPTPHSPLNTPTPHSSLNPLMRCRHCLRYSLGCCVKNGGHSPAWREPLYLVMGNGKRFQLRFDCKNCEMLIFST